MIDLFMDTLGILVASAIGIGFIHTLIGVDHTLPFVVLGRARGWSLARTLRLTAVCGLGHVASSVLLGSFGLGLGVALGRLKGVEEFRGNLAAWVLIVFGLVYAAWSMARKRRSQREAHAHETGVVHAHGRGISVAHQHGSDVSGASLTAWSLFVVFVLGPCEPLIPLLMVPALDLGAMAAVPVTLAFAVTTIGTMMVVVAAAYYGLRMPAFRHLEAHAHTLAGLTIAFSGLLIQLLGI